MAGNFTPICARDLAEEWHDETIDLESLVFSPSSRQVEFSVTYSKAIPPKCLLEEPLVKDVAIRLYVVEVVTCKVRLSGVTRLEIDTDPGEVQFFVGDVRATSNSLVLKGGIGTIGCSGKDLQVAVETSDKISHKLVRLSVGIVEYEFGV